MPKPHSKSRWCPVCDGVIRTAGVTHSSECPARPVTCEGCGEDVPAFLLGQHGPQCRARVGPVICGACGQVVPADSLTQHGGTCPARLVPCERCFSEIRESDRAQHLTKDCKAKTCRGCGALVRERLRDHYLSCPARMTCSGCGRPLPLLRSAKHRCPSGDSFPPPGWVSGGIPGTGKRR